MVGVAPDSGRHELSTKHNPMVKYLLKQKEEHARTTYKHDYSHVFRRKTRFELFRLSAIAMAIEFAYAAETAFVSPILLQIGVDHKSMSMAWGLSPLLGFFISPLLGSISDRCKLTWGRRRPIITLLSIGILFGLILVPHGKAIGQMFGDTGYNYTELAINQINSSSEGSVAALLPEGLPTPPPTSSHKIAIILTVLGMVLLDFSADTCQTPARTYLLDLCTAEDQPIGLTSFTLLAGIGGTIGYAIGGIDWENTRIGTFLGGNVQTVFGLVLIIFIVCYIITITTFREIPLKLIERDDMLKPLSTADVKKEKNKKLENIYYIKENTALDLQIAEKDANNVAELEASLPIESYQNSYPKTVPTLTSNAKDQATESMNPTAPDEENEGPVSLRQYLKSIFIMPRSMAILSLTNLFCWMGHVAYCLYFTDFVGEAVFHGNPQAPPNTDAADLYEAGVRFGCFGMSIYAFSCSVYSATVSKLMKWFGARTVYIVGILYYGFGMLILGLWPTKWGVLFFSTSAGILYGTLFTMPYILVANYHAKNCFRKRNGETMPLKLKRGLGTDIAIMSSMVFVAQLIVSLIMGPLVEWMQTTCAILFASTVFSIMAAICAMFVLYV